MLNIPRGFDDKQCRAYRDHLAFCASKLNDGSSHWAFHFDGCLVRHHVRNTLVFCHSVSDLDVPSHNFSLGNSFANIR